MSAGYREEEEYEPTPEEAAAIRSLRRLARKWPKTLGLFSWSGTLYVIRLPEHTNGLLQEDGKPLLVGDSIRITNGGGDPG